MMKYVVALLISFLSLNLSAHPHSFLEMYNQVQIQEEKLTGFQMRWQLDEITSAELIYEINSSDNKQAAMEKITKELDGSAVENHFFSELYNAKNEQLTFKNEPVNSSVEVKDNRIIYQFTLTLAEPQAVKGQSFRLYTFEPSYYLYMSYEWKDGVTINSPLCKVDVIDPSVSQSLRLYASKLDKTETPEMPAGEFSLGKQFAQTVSLQCP